MKFIIYISILLFGIFTTTFAVAQTIGLPDARARGGAGLVGTQTCGSSTCHNSAIVWPNSAVKQNEYAKWKIHDPHRNATTTLLSPKAKDIASKLGIPSAISSNTCLDCHAFNVPNAKRKTPISAHTKIENGIACEACHGPGENWIGVHTAGLYFYEANIKAGMFPTADASARTQLCMSCHIGSEDKLVTHRMLAAGHPRPTFEVNFYTWFSAHEMTGREYYSHFEVDSDYRQRKPLPYGLKVWAIGQVEQAKHTLDLILSPKLNAGLVPELSLYNCDSCHRQISHTEAGNSPGYPRINMSNLYFVSIIGKIISPDVAKRLQQKIARIQNSVTISQAALITESKSIQTDIEQLLPMINAHVFTTQDRIKIIDLITSPNTQSQFIQFQTAEQALLATASIVDELYRKSEISKQQFEDAQTILNQTFTHIDSGPSYSPDMVRTAFARIRSLVI